MPFMICKNCDVYYEIADKNLGNDLKTCQCGCSMSYYDKLEDYLNSDLQKTSSVPIMDKLTSDYESVLSRIVLMCLNQVPIKLGIKRLMLVLKGNNSPFIFKYDINKLETYGILNNFSEEDLRYIVDVLTDMGYIETEYLSQFEGSTLKCTSEGQEFLSNAENIRIGFVKKSKN
jgi:superfamily II DNA helicase RecQ